MSEAVTMTRRSSKKIPALIIHAILFYTFWACWALLIRPALLEVMQDTLLFAIFGSCVKLLVWVFPALLLAKHFSSELCVGFRQMFTQKVPLKSVIFWSLVFFLIGGGDRLLALFRGNLHINPDFTLKSHLWLLVVGITEEAVFRGWMLNATAKNEKDWKMLLLNGIMFLCIHFPGWIEKGTFVSAFTGFGFLSVILFGVLAGICFLKHKNLLLIVFIHMFYDFILEFWIVG
ncbi:MAG: CPBP family intramembrane metalloprotease [Oscillospiraceae bacterium]|nr:CPBP family intramembrane metalloprotease [Oscillospiraceae bacterium]